MYCHSKDALLKEYQNSQKKMAGMMAVCVEAFLATNIAEESRLPADYQSAKPVYIIGGIMFKKAKVVFGRVEIGVWQRVWNK